MTKPWEETWEAREDDVWEPERRVVVSRETDRDDAKLIAAAPEMARLLLEAEWGGLATAGYDTLLMCPWCSGDGNSHQPGCKLVAVLVKAGVRAS